MKTRFGNKRLFGLMGTMSVVTAMGVNCNQPVEAERTLRRATDAMATHMRSGGWADQWSLGGDVVWGQKGVIPKTWITVQPAATPATANIYVEAARVLGDERYLTHARAARDALLALRTPEGGFPKEGDPASGPHNTASFDDDVTTSALEFLMALWRHTGAEEDHHAVEQVGAFIIRAQYRDSGGWPQRFPLPDSHYGSHITFNDDVMANLIRVLLELDKLTGDARYLAAAVRGGECIIRLQGGAGQEIWAQQYDAHTLEPASGRSFEPAGYTPNESKEICDSLIELYLATGQDRFLKPLPRAFAWYDTHRLPNGKWARLYEPETQRPVYGLPGDGGITYEVARARPGYSWQGRWYPHDAKRAYGRIKVVGREAVLIERMKTRNRLLRATDQRVQQICAELSPNGFWLSPPDQEQARLLGEAGVPEKKRKIIRTDVFCENARILLDYLAR